MKKIYMSALSLARASDNGDKWPSLGVPTTTRRAHCHRCQRLSPKRTIGGRIGGDCSAARYAGSPLSLLR